MDFLEFLRYAKEVEHEGYILNHLDWDWTLLKVHRYGWSSRSGLHRVVFLFPPLFESFSYTYYLIKPIAIITSDTLITPQGVWEGEIADYPIPENLLRFKNFGVVYWTVARGISEVLICEYTDKFDEEIAEDIILRAIADRIKGD